VAGNVYLSGEFSAPLSGAIAISLTGRNA
jgi:hypothetical protein